MLNIACECGNATFTLRIPPTGLTAAEVVCTACGATAAAASLRAWDALPETTTATAPAVPAPGTPEADMLAHLIRYGGEAVRAAADALAASGYIPHLANSRSASGKPPAYLRWTVGDHGPTVGYLNSASLDLSSDGLGDTKEQRLAELAAVSGGEVKARGTVNVLLANNAGVVAAIKAWGQRTA
jgi:hypothetical protein